jgi:enoyl-CoA hydratase
VLTGDPIPAERAAAFGFVNVLCEDGRALDEALALAERIACNAPLAVRESLRVLEQTAAVLDDVGWQLSADAAKAVFGSEDAREGRDAFLAERAPVWRNR